MKMYTVHQDATLIPLSFTSPVYRLGEDELPAISASASRDATGRVHISVANIAAAKAHSVEIDVTGLSVTRVTGELLTSPTLQDYNSFEVPERIKPVPFEKAEFKDGKLRLEVPPFSLVVLELI